MPPLRRACELALAGQVLSVSEADFQILFVQRERPLYVLFGLGRKTQQSLYLW